MVSLCFFVPFCGNSAAWKSPLSDWEAGRAGRLDSPDTLPQYLLAQAYGVVSTKEGIAAVLSAAWDGWSESPPKTQVNTAVVDRDGAVHSRRCGTVALLDEQPPALEAKLGIG
jgi:hypothetical protein